MKTSHPVHIMVFRVVSRGDDVMPSFFFPHNLILITEVYIKYYDEVVIPWISVILQKQENPELAVRKFLLPFRS